MELARYAKHWINKCKSKKVSVEITDTLMYYSVLSMAVLWKNCNLRNSQSIALNDKCRFRPSIA